MNRNLLIPALTSCDRMLRKKLVIFAAIMLVSIPIFFQSIITGDLLSSSSIENDGLYPFIIVCLFVAFAYLKRSYIAQKMQCADTDSSYMVMGIGTAAIAVFLSLNSSRPTFTLLCALMYGLGIFAALFGPASIMFSAALLVVVFTTALPYIMSVLLEPYYSNAIATIVYHILNASGISTIMNNNLITITAGSGEQISAIVDSACSGTASLSVFMVLFIFMILDMPFPPKTARFAFIIGIFGTILQNIARIVIIFTSGYLWGSDEMFYIHSFAGYVIFPVWYSIFAIAYVESYKRYTRYFV